MTEERIERRGYLKIIGTLIGGLVIGGAAGWLSKPAERVTETVTAPGVTETVTVPAATVTETIAKTVTKTVTTPVTPTPTPIVPEIPFEGVKLKGLMMSDPPNLAFEKLAKEFAEAHGMSVEFEMYDWEHLRDKEMSALAGGLEYDVVLLDEPWVAERGKYLLDMEELMSKYADPDLLAFDDFLPGTLGAMRTYEGELTSLPMMTDVRFLAYRKSYFEDPKNKEKFKELYGYDLKPPLNYVEFFDVAEFMKEYTDMPHGYSSLWATGYLECTFGDWLYSYGGSYFDENWIPRYNSPEGIIALRQMLKSLEYGPENRLELTHELADVAYFAEDVPMVMNWWSVLMEMLDPEINPHIDDTGFAPAFHSKIASGMMGYAIPKASKHEAQAYKVIEWAYSKQNAAKMIGYGGVPVRTSTLESAEIKATLRIPEIWDGALATLERGLWYRPKFLYHGVHAEILCSWVYRAMAGEVGVEEALSNAAKEVKTELEKVGFYK